MFMRVSSRLLGSVATVVGPLALLAATPVAAHAGAGPDHLTITVADSDNGGDGTSELECSPAGGTHSDPGAACGRLDELEAQGVDPFAPVAGDARCTMQYGARPPPASRGPGTAAPSTPPTRWATDARSLGGSRSSPCCLRPGRDPRSHGHRVVTRPARDPHILYVGSVASGASSPTSARRLPPVIRRGPRGRMVRAVGKSQ